MRQTKPSPKPFGFGIFRPTGIYLIGVVGAEMLFTWPIGGGFLTLLFSVKFATNFENYGVPEVLGFNGATSPHP
jgi:hypothetical protein